MKEDVKRREDGKTGMLAGMRFWGCSRVVFPSCPLCVRLIVLSVSASERAMVLAALLSALGGVWAGAYETPVPANMVAGSGHPSLRKGGPRVGVAKN